MNSRRLMGPFVLASMSYPSTSFGRSRPNRPHVGSGATTKLMQCSKHALFDDLVGKCRKHRRYLETKCPSGFEVNDELELNRLVDR